LGWFQKGESSGEWGGGKENETWSFLKKNKRS
jgi:hypothetical protein